MVDKVTKQLSLDLSKVPRSQRKTVKQEVGDFVVNEILRQVSEGKSPVSGEGKFKRLNKNYAESSKGGDRTANLELEGDLLDALESKNTASGIEVGIFRSSQVGKADGHNNFSGESRLPKRRFIPDQEQRFKQDIERGINRIIRDFERVDTPTNRPAREVTGGFVDSQVQAGISIDDIFSDIFGDEFLDG